MHGSQISANPGPGRAQPIYEVSETASCQHQHGSQLWWKIFISSLKKPVIIWLLLCSQFNCIRPILYIYIYNGSKLFFIFNILIIFIEKFEENTLNS